MRFVSQDARRGGHAPAADVRLEVRGMGDSVGILPINAVRSPTTAGTIRMFIVTHAGFDQGQSMSILHPWYESAQYPILRPLGEDGWTPSMTSSIGRRRITLARYCTQEILRSQYLTSAGRLFGEWTCDNASRLHDERLSYIQHNQRRLVPFTEMRTAAGARGRGRQNRGRQANSGRNRGRGRRAVQTRVVEPRPGSLPGRTILPASFTTSPRWYRNYLEDALAVGARLGAPTFFITLTANTRWPEIVNELLPGQSAADRPDITLRVFRSRMLALRPHLEDIFCPNGVRYSLQVYEFQHRGQYIGKARLWENCYSPRPRSTWRYFCVCVSDNYCRGSLTTKLLATPDVFSRLSSFQVCRTATLSCAAKVLLCESTKSMSTCARKCRLPATLCTIQSSAS